MSAYDDILVRSYFDELSEDHDGASCSVDIIPYGQDILTWEKANVDYDKVLCDPNHSVISARSCNCYIRGRNTSPVKATTGRAQMFLMPFNVFTNPQKWYVLKAYDSHTKEYTDTLSMISKASGQVSSEVGPNEVCISENAFLLNDTYNLKAGEHYCLCAVVNTPDHPVVIPANFSSNREMDRWVVFNHNVALLNVIPVKMTYKQTAYSFDFGNKNRKKCNFVLQFKFYCDRAAKESWPTQLPVRIQCTDSNCLFDYQDQRISSQQESSDYQTIMVPVDNVPSDFYGKCNVYIDNVAPLPAHGYVEMIYYQVHLEIPEEYASEKHRFVSHEGIQGYLFPLGNAFVYNSDMTIHKFYQIKAQAKV